MSQANSVKIIRKISEAKRELGSRNIQGCLLQFKAALEIAVSETVLPADKKSIEDEIEKLQGEIQNNRAFKNIYGPVTFERSEFDVTLSFLKQLIQASAEELFESTDLARPAGPQSAAGDSDPKRDSPSPESDLRLEEIMKIIDEGNLGGAKEAIGGDDALMDRVIEVLNERGISFRSAGNYEDAVSCYNKGLEISPMEEGLHYNLARAGFEKGDLKTAIDHLEKALEIDAAFAPGRELYDFIKSKQNNRDNMGAGEKDGVKKDPGVDEKKGIFSTLGVTFRRILVRKPRSA